MLKRIAVTLATMAVGLLAFAPSPASASGWWLQYSNTSSGNCLDVKSSSAGNGAIIQEFPCKNPGTSGAANQKFQTQPMGSAYQIVASHSGKCIDVVGSSTANGATVQQWACTGAANQQWNLVYVSSNPSGSNNYLFQNVNSGKCLNRTSSGFALYQTTCNSSSSAQVWRQHFKESGCTTCLAADRTATIGRLP